MEQLLSSLPKPSPAFGGARQQSPKIRILKIGGTFWLKSELFLTKIRTANFDAPPRHRSLRSLFRKKVFFAIFYFVPARFFLLKGKENFFAGFCSWRAGRRGFASASGQKFLPPDPLPFCPLTFGLRPIFCGRAIIKIYSRPCPTPPVRGRHKGTPLMISVDKRFKISYHYSRKNTHFIK